MTVVVGELLQGHSPLYRRGRVQVARQHRQPIRRHADTHQCSTGRGHRKAEGRRHKNNKEQSNGDVKLFPPGERVQLV
jgi:hypothetical protein